MEQNLMAGARHPTQVRPWARPGNNKIEWLPLLTCGSGRGWWKRAA